MQLSDDEARFLAKRTRFVKTWRGVGVVLLILLSVLTGWLFWFVPLLANPFSVLSRLQEDSVPVSTMALATALLPIVSLFCLLMAFVIVLFVFVVISNEKSYLAIVRRLAAHLPDGDRL
jgi:hypothetical protein